MKNKYFERLVKKTKSLFICNKKISLLIVLAVIGIALIFISEFKIDLWNNNSEKESLNKTNTVENYTGKLEEKIKNIISIIDGVGNAEVMITLESGEENVFAEEQKKNFDKVDDTENSGDKKISQKETNEKKYIIIEDENGNKKALLKKTLEPVVKGVVVVCEGAESPKIESKITETVAIALDIPWNKVCVNKKAI